MTWKIDYLMEKTKVVTLFPKAIKQGIVYPYC
jgi:hypothetical protein